MHRASRTPIDQPAQDTSAHTAHTTDDAGGQSYVEQIKRANREVFTLYELARVFSSSLNLNETLSLFAKKVGDFVPYDTCAIFLSMKLRRRALRRPM